MTQPTQARRFLTKPGRRAGPVGGRSNTAAWLLLAPAIVLIALAFLMPLGGFLWRAVDNSSFSNKLPGTIQALQSWDHATAPTDALATAMIGDLRAQAEQRGAIAALAREMNELLPGFRNVVMQTGREVPDAAVSGSSMEWLASVDQQWRDPEIWIALKSHDGYFTDRYILTTVGFERSVDRGLTLAPSDKRIYADVLVRTLWMSLVVSSVTLLLAYPLAYALAHSSPGWRTLILCAVMLPFLTSLLVRTLAWVIILQKEGAINQLLIGAGIVEQPLSMLYTRGAVYLGMLHLLLPFMILPISNTMLRIPPNRMKAALSLGATPLQAIFNVYLPATLPGVSAGVLIVGVLTLGFYVTPEFLGGPKDQMVSHFVSFFTNRNVNWGMASAMGLWLLILAVALVGSMRWVTQHFNPERQG